MRARALGARFERPDLPALDWARAPALLAYCVAFPPVSARGSARTRVHPDPSRPMNSLRLSVGLAALGELAAPGLAQLQAPQSALLLLDDLQTQDQLILARDLDGDGFFAAANELATAYQNN